MKTLFRAILHAAIGGIGTGLMMIPAGVPITMRTVIFPALGSALTSIFSLLTRNGAAADRK